MKTKLSPYLNFKDSAGPAMKFYQTVFGGKLDVTTYKDFQMSRDPSQDNLLMHASLETPQGMTLMASDVVNMPFEPGNTVRMILSGDDEAEMRDLWNKLSEGATIVTPLATSDWGDLYGMLTDKFGIDWMMNIAAKPKE